VLDQAAAEGWSLTHALEQLLRIEVTATDACRLAEEMAFLVKKGNEIADRLEVQIAASRKVNPAAAAGLSGLATPAAAPVERATVGAVKPQAPQDPAAEAAARGIAKLTKRKLSGADSELMRTLQAIR